MMIDLDDYAAVVALANAALRALPEDVAQVS
jgi:hypothetical protein